MKPLNPKNIIHRIRGRFRLFMCFCPRCNSDAPLVYNCSVCKMVHTKKSRGMTEVNKRHYPINNATKALWWYSWMHPSFEDMQNKYFDCIEEKSKQLTEEVCRTRAQQNTKGDTMKYKYVGGGYFRDKHAPQGVKADIIHAPVYVAELQDEIEKWLDEINGLEGKCEEYRSLLREARTGIRSKALYERITDVL